MAGRGVALTPGAPEGRGSDGYLSAGPAGVGSQTGSVDSGEWCVIRESVDSLCRDGADTPMPPYIGKAFTRTNFEDLSLFRYLTIVYESLCTQ